MMKLLWATTFLLILLDVSLWTWNKGFNDGYQMAMANITLGIDTPDAFFKKIAEGKTPEEIINIGRGNGK